MNDNFTNDISLLNRKNLTITGVKKVIKFYPEEIVLDTTKGIIKIYGSNLELIDLNNQNTNIKINGLISKIEYIDKIKKDESFISKLFK